MEDNRRVKIEPVAKPPEAETFKNFWQTLIYLFIRYNSEILFIARPKIAYHRDITFKAKLSGSAGGTSQAPMIARYVFKRKFELKD
jgi:hypothetical protein